MLSLQELRQLLSGRFVGDEFQSLRDLPHPHSLKDCQKGAQIIAKAMRENQKILVIGDYDVDGIMACVVMMRGFEMLGFKNAEYVIPNRFRDGYGVSVELLKRQRCDVVITVDNGITAFDVGDYCHQNHLTLIITDHHQIQERLPRAQAVINPQQPGCHFPQKEISGAAVAWYFCNAIKIACGKDFSLQGLLKYVALASIADMMPLVRLNKLFVKKGLEQLKQSHEEPFILLRSLLSSSDFRAQDVSFSIIPLLNSAGRIEDARLVCELFLSPHQAKEIFSHLQRLNLKRKDLTQKGLESIQKSLIKTPHCVIGYGEDLCDGVLGIIASKLVEEHGCPAFVFVKKEDGSFKGSGRSDGRINIFAALLGYKEEFLHFGGHCEAVGLSVDFKTLQRLPDFFASAPREQKESQILGTLPLELVNEEILAILEEFEPYGHGNPVPQFAFKNLKISQVQRIKGVHQRLEFNQCVWGIEFYASEFFEAGMHVDAVGMVVRDFRKKPSLLLKNAVRRN